MLTAVKQLVEGCTVHLTRVKGLWRRDVGDPPLESSTGILGMRQWLDDYPFFIEQQYISIAEQLDD